MDLDLRPAFRESWARVGGWIEAFVQHLPNLVAAILVLLLFGILASLVRALVRGVMERTTDHGPVRRLVATVAHLAVLLAGLFVALGVLDLDRTVTSLLAGAGIVGLALAFAFQDTAENFISGVLISVRKPFTDGDLVETNGHLGTVRQVTLRSTVLRTPQGQVVRIPNNSVYSEPLVNYTESGMRRVDLSCGVAYGDDLEEATRIAVEAVEGVGGRSEELDVELFYEEFGDSSVNFVVRFWIPFRGQTDFLRARSEAIVRLKKAFDEAGVTIPFPIRTLDFDPVGGRRLAEELDGREARGL